MFNIDLKTKKNIRKYIDTTKKRQAGDFNDAFFMKVVTLWTLLGIIPSLIGLMLIETLPLVLLLPITTIIGSLGICLNELRILNRDIKNDKKLNNVIEILENSNIKTNLNNLSKSVVLEDVIFTEEVPSDKLISNNCYVFKDNDGNLQGLLEDDSSKEIKYYTLGRDEIKKLVEYSPKVKKLVKRKEY